MASKRSSNRKRSFAKRHPKLLTALVIIVVILIAAVVALYFLRPDIFSQFGGQPHFSDNTDDDNGNTDDDNDNTDDDNDNTDDNNGNTDDDGGQDDPEGTNGAVVEVPEGDLAEISGAEFSIHFLELGNEYTGDCTLIDCGDVEILIDAGSRKSSATTINSYIDQYCEDGVLEYVIATHAHQDHIAGFVGNSSGGTRTGVLYNFEVETLIQFSGHNTDSQIYKDYVTATEYCQEEYGTDVYSAIDCWNNANGASRSYDINEDGSLTLNILYNYYYENSTSDENDYSVCVLLSYEPEGGEASHYLFTGDLEGDGEDYLVEYNNLPEVVLFKGGHHGSKTSSTEKLLQVIQPQYVAVCCCSGSTEYTDNNDNTFPTQDFINRVSAYTDAVYCTTLADDSTEGFTSMNGNIVFYYDTSLHLWCSNNTTKLKDTDWFKANRVCENWGWTESDRESFNSSQ